MRYLRYVSYTIFILLLCSFVYTGITTVPFEVDSTSYHIPLAQEILKGNAMNPRSFHFPNPTYPGSTEVLLAAFVVLKIPLNLFNVLGWATLFVVLKKLGTRSGLRDGYDTLFALAFCVLPTVVRLVYTQTADIWLDVFFVYALYLLTSPTRDWLYFTKLGLTLGMVAGAKFSGPLFCIIVVAVYLMRLLNNSSVRNIFAAIVPFILTGASWYIRNIVWYGNPVYPSPALFFKGVEGFSRYMQTHAITMISSFQGFRQTLDAWISEYIGWTILAIWGPVLLLIQRLRNRMDGITSLLAVGTGSLAVYLIVPGYPFAYQNIVSEVRYGHPAMIAFMLAAFIVAQSWTKAAWIVAILTICPLIFLLPLPYTPKGIALVMWTLTAAYGIASRYIRVLK